MNIKYFYYNVLDGYDRTKFPIYDSSDYNNNSNKQEEVSITLGLNNRIIENGKKTNFYLNNNIMAERLYIKHIIDDVLQCQKWLNLIDIKRNGTATAFFDADPMKNE
jgi:hypothetical protein